MSESFSVRSSLTISTNVEAVLRTLIEQFEVLDKRIKGTQELLAQLGKTKNEAGSSGASMAKAFSELKLPGSLVSEITKVADFGKSIATSAKEAAASWSKMAEAARVVRSAQDNMGRGGGGGRGGGSGGRGGGRGGRRGGGGSGDEGPLAHWQQQDPAERAYDQMSDHLFGRRDREAKALDADYNARDDHRRKLAEYENRNFDARVKFLQSQADHERKAAEYEDRDFNARAKFAQQRADNDRKAAEYQNRDFNLRADNDRKAAEYENRNRDLAEAKRARAAGKEYDDKYRLANLENRDFDLRAKRDAYKPMTHHDHMTGAMGYQMAGNAGVSYLEQSVGTSFEFEKEMLPFSFNDTITDDDRKEILDKAKQITREVPGVTRADAVKGISELYTLTNDLKASMASAKTFAQMTRVYENIPGMHQGDHAFASMQSLELLQRFYDPVTHKISAEEATKGMIAEARVAIQTRGRAAPEDYRAVAKSSRAAGMLADDQFLYEDLPAAMIAMGGSRAGTAIAGGYREFARGTMTKGVAADLQKLGLLDKSAKWDHGRVPNMEKHLEGFELFQRNQIEWVRKVLLPELKRHGVDTQDRGKLEAALTPLASTNVVLGGLSEYAVGMEGIDKEADKARHTSVGKDKDGKTVPVNPFNTLVEKSPLVQLQDYRAAQNELMLTIGELLKGPAIQILKEATRALHGLTDWFDAHPDAGKKFALYAADIAIGAKIFGGLALGAVFLAPMASLTKSFFTLGGALVWLTGVILRASGAAGAGAAAEAALGGGAAGPRAAKAAGLARMSLFGPIAATGAATIGAFKGAQMTGEDIAKHGEERNETPLMMDEYGRPIGYYNPDTKKMGSPESMVSPPQNSTTGTEANPTHVVVVNQLSEASISRGVASNIASKGNRPAGGFTGADHRIDPFGTFQGMVN